MSESQEPAEESTQFTLRLASPTGAFNVVAVLESDKEGPNPPRLVTVSKEDSDGHTSDVHSSDRETQVVLSVGSGHRLAARFFQDTVSPLLKHIYGEEEFANIQIHETKSETSILQLVSECFFPEAQQGKPLRIILASGDGGIVDLVNGLLAKPASPKYVAPQVVLLPLGTANALYHSINAGRDNTWGLDTLTSATSKPLPVFTASFSPGSRLLVDEARSEEELPKDPTSGHGVLHGAVVCSWGMHASLVADSDTPEYRKYGVDRFKMAAQAALYPVDGSPPHPYTAKVSVRKGDAAAWSTLPGTQHLYVLATLVSHLEHPFCISPHSTPLDGSLHLVHFGPTSGDEAMRIMGQAYQGGKHIQDPAVRYEAIDGLRIEFERHEDEPRWRRICIDGKIVRVESNGWVEVKKQPRRALEVVTRW
ncbi:hypothetical protein ACN47E_008310 [Coniothyrium glycines]